MNRPDDILDAFERWRMGSIPIKHYFWDRDGRRYVAEPRERGKIFEVTPDADPLNMSMLIQQLTTRRWGMTAQAIPAGRYEGADRYVINGAGGEVLGYIYIGVNVATEACAPASIFVNPITGQPFFC